MSRRTLGFLALALVLAAGCIRLGFWQLDRLAQRRAANAIVAGRLAAPASPLEEVVRDSAPRYRAVTVRGTYDYAHELVLASRTREGSPGVNFLTPLRIAGRDTAVLVNRGWVYAPDGQTVESARWRERDTATVAGYVETLSNTVGGAVGSAARPRVVRRLHRDSVAARLPYPISPLYVVARHDAGGSIDSTPVRLPAPAIDEGPHRSYALQWFAFATIAVVGAGIVAASERRRGR